MLRHRFWQSPAREQVSGRKYIGLLLYASERDDYRYTMLAGSELVGTVRPARWDNRRHLIVAERPIEILGGGVPFTVRAEGTGPCYLEKVLFLSELPDGIDVRAAPGPAEHPGDRPRNGRAVRHRLRAGDRDRDGDAAGRGRRRE